jgi:hypothetical protein
MFRFLSSMLLEYASMVGVVKWIWVINDVSSFQAKKKNEESQYKVIQDEYRSTSSFC